MKELGRFDSPEPQDKFGLNLARKVQSACKDARTVGPIDPKTGLPPEFVKEAERERDLLKNNKEVTLRFMRKPYIVSVKASHNYPLLIKLSLRQLLKTNYGFTDEELNTEDSQKHYARWYSENLKYQTEHEFGHLLGAVKHTDLKSVLGVEFYKTQEGRYCSRPFIDFAGTVLSKTFIKYVVNAPKLLSKSDKISRG